MVRRLSPSPTIELGEEGRGERGRGEGGGREGEGERSGHGIGRERGERGGRKREGEREEEVEGKGWREDTQ